MNHNETPPIEAIDFSADSYSLDGRKIVVSLATKDPAERRTYSLPVTSLYNFIADLQKLKSAGPAEQAKAPAPEPIPEPPTPPATDPNRINITVPKKWMLKSGLPEYPFVIMVFDPQTAAQSGFALSGASAREMAAGLVKYADALAHYGASKTKGN